MEKLKKILSKYFDLFYKHRYLIMILVFCLCVLLKVSGSSIGCWNQYILANIKDNSIGIDRGVRSDEWATLTPMFFGQVENGFRYFNTALRGTATDVFMVYALPVKYIFQIFRPFLLGFIIFGAERGLSFFWCGRLIALFLVSLDFFMILTKKNKPLSFVGSFMILFAPIVQWWFAVNGIAELFIFGELIIIMLYKYLNTDSFKKRLLYLLVIYICAGGYALIMYPSWQIPMAFVYLALAIWVLIENYKKEKIKLKDIISIIVMIGLLGISLYIILNKSMDTIKTVTNTDYPGKRFELGGGQIGFLFSYVIGMFLPFKGENLFANAPEQAMFFTLFPIGLILSIRELIKKGKKDRLLIILLICYLFLGTWCIVGFPKILAKITMLYNSQAHRSLIALGFLDILLLLRSLSINRESMPKKFALALTFALTGLIVYKVKMFEGVYVGKKMIVIMVITCLGLFYTALRYSNKKCKYLFCLGMIFVMFICGSMVNPIRFGAGVFTKSEILKNVKRIDKKDRGIWITEGEAYPVNNYIAIAGVKTINVTNTYPDLDKWYKLDKNKKYKSIYNRYAHITINLVDEEKDKFELKNPDVFVVNIDLKDLDTLNVKYIFTRNNLEKYNNEKYRFKKIYKYNNYNIYNVMRNN